MFLELPLARSVGPAGSEGGFWIEVAKEVAAGFRDRFETLKSDTPCPFLGVRFRSFSNLA